MKKSIALELQETWIQNRLAIQRNNYLIQRLQHTMKQGDESAAIKAQINFCVGCKTAYTVIDYKLSKILNQKPI
jgi:hypothetical protein